MNEKPQVFKRVCAWCNKDMGTVVWKSNGLEDCDTTHGMCEACFDEHTPKPFIDEALVMQVQMLAGRNVHAANGALHRYNGIVYVYERATCLKVRLEYRELWIEQVKELIAIVSAEKRRKAKHLMI